MWGAVGNGAQSLSLRRGVLARIRLFGAAESASFLGVLVIGFLAIDLANGTAPISGGWVGDTLVVLYLVLSVAVRVAVATEYVSADEHGVRWRSLFRSWFLPWDQIESMDIGQIYLFPSRSRDDVIQVRTTDTRVRKLRA